MNKNTSLALAVMISFTFTLSVCQAAEKSISYQIRKDGIVSLGIYRANGSLVRTLQSGKKTAPGVHEIAWDGKDDEGRDCQPGRYALKGISSNIKGSYVMVAGNPGNPPYKTTDGLGAWNGFWGTPNALAVDKTGVYIQYSMEEGDGSLIKMTPGGKLIWKAHVFQGDGWGYTQAMAADGRYVYVAEDIGDGGDMRSTKRKCIVWRVEASTGNYALWNGHALFVGQPYESDPVPFWEIVNSDRTTPSIAFGTNGGADVRGLAVRNGKLYVPLYRKNKIEIWDTNTGKLISSMNDIPAPQGISFDASGNLYVASRRTVLRIVPGGNVATAVKGNLVAPYSVAVDGAGGIYVTDLGSSQQVKKFSPKGKLVWVSGKKGGRPFSGKWDSSSFLYPSGLAIGKDGKVYVGENSPPSRFAALDSKGRMVRNWVGTLSVGASCGLAIDESDPSYAYALTMGGGMYYCAFNLPLIRFKMDYTKRQWKVDAYWWGIISPHPRRDYMSLSGPRMISWGQSDFYIRHYKGHMYLFCGQHYNHPIWRVEGYSMIPCVCIGQDSRWLPIDLDKGYTFDAHNNPALRSPDKAFIWRDLDNDGQAGSNEVRFFDEPKGMGGHGGWGAFIDHDMSVYIPDSLGTKNVYKLPCLGVDEKNNPMYSWDKAEIVIPADKSTLASLDYARTGQPDKDGQKADYPVERVALGPDGSIYGTVEIAGQDKGIGWATSFLDVKVGKWDTGGNLIWKTGTKATGFAKPGQFYTGKGIDGVIKGFVFFTDMNGQSRIYTDDGLYVGNMPSVDSYRGAAFGPDVLLVELCQARVFTDPKTGNDYYAGGDETGLHVWRLDGLKSVERFEVPVDLS